jgi:hypothetical protein
MALPSDKVQHIRFAEMCGGEYAHWVRYNPGMAARHKESQFHHAKKLGFTTPDGHKLF